MASIKYYVNGAGGTLGADLAILKPLYMSGVIWYVGNAVSGASDSNAGTDRDLPLLTLQQAVTNSAAGDMIDILASHRETITATVTISKSSLSIVGEGAGSTAPRLTNGIAAASGPMISIENVAVLIDNIYFPASTVVARERIYTVGGGTSGVATLNDLVFECSANDATRTVRLGSVGPDVLRGCTFTATGADAGYAVELVGENGVTMESCVFDAGSFNWNDGAIIVETTATKGLRLTGVSLLNGSNMTISITASTGIIQIAEMSGDSMINWTP